MCPATGIATPSMATPASTTGLDPQRLQPEPAAEVRSAGMGLVLTAPF
jgi:hypothetical protein